MEFATSEEICEALTRHVEMSGSEAFGKHFEQGGRTTVAIFCVVGPNAARFRRMAEQWLERNGFTQD